MMVSVIVLTYNQEHTIARTLDSILAQQTDFDYEVVIGEDASTDTTRDICVSYSKRHADIIRLMPAAPNKGLVRNYFDCFAETRGDFIADCSGDDEWLDSLFLARHVAKLESDENISLSHSAVRRIYRDRPPEDSTISNSPATFERATITSRLLRRDPSVTISLSASVYRRSMLAEAMNLHPDLFIDPDNVCEDLPIWIAMAQAGNIAYDPTPSLGYHIEPGSASSAVDFDRHARFRLGTLRQTIALQNAIGIADSEMRRYYRKTIEYLLAQIYRATDSTLIESLNRLLKGKPMPLSIKSRIYLTLIRLRKH